MSKLYDKLDVHQTNEGEFLGTIGKTDAFHLTRRNRPNWADDLRIRVTRTGMIANDDDSL
jgi:hypothetical protein